MKVARNKGIRQISGQVIGINTLNLDQVEAIRKTGRSQGGDRTQISGGNIHNVSKHGAA
jgi:hypothetical protein